MQINVENLTPVKFRIAISVDADDVRGRRDKLYTTLRRQVQIRGFRPGKAPRSLLERHYGDNVNEEIRGDLLQEALGKAIEDNHLRVVGRPEIESSAFTDEGGFTASATVEVSPKVEPKDYKGVAIKRMKVEVTDEAVQARLEGLARMRATVKTIEEDRPAEKGDTAEIDFNGTKDGKPFEGGQAEKYLLEIGTGSFIPLFEDSVIGMRKGEEKDINLTFPEDYGSRELAGQPVVFHVKLHAIKQRVVPALDDEFAKDIGEKYRTLEDLRIEQRKHLEEEAGRRVRDHDFEQLTGAILKFNEFDVPETLIASQTRMLVERLRQNLSYSGIAKPDIEAMMEGASERLRPEAVKDVKAMLVIEAIAEKEGLAASEDEVQAKYEEIARLYGKSSFEISAEYQKEDRVEDLKFRIRQDKTVDFLLENAQALWVGPQLPVPGEEFTEEPADADPREE